MTVDVETSLNRFFSVCHLIITKLNNIIEKRQQDSDSLNLLFS